MNESLKLALCEMQAELFVRAKEKGYASEPFIKAFMNSDIAEDLDMPFNHMQWAGAHYLMSRMEEEHGDALQSGECYASETLYWAGYLYRYWHIYTQESSREIYKQAPARTMQIVWLMYHTMSPEMAIDRLKGTYLDKRKKNYKRDECEDARLLAVATQRTAQFNAGEAISAEEVYRSLGISAEDIAACDEVEFE